MNNRVRESAVQDSWTSIPIPSASSTMDAYLVVPAAPSRGDIVLLQEIFGVNEAMRDMARAFATEGYTVLAPDLFWRLEPRVDLGYGEDDRKRGFALMQKYDQADGADDIRIAAKWLRQHSSPKPVAMVGYCLGGRMAVLAGAENPDVSAIISFYGVRLDLCADKLRSLPVPFQFHVGDSDAHVTAEHTAAVKNAVSGKPDAEVSVYPGAQHGFCNRLRTDVFAKDAAALAGKRALTLLEKVMG